MTNNIIEELRLDIKSDDKLIVNAPGYYLNYFNDNHLIFDHEIEKDIYNVMLIFGVSNEEIMQYASLYIDFLNKSGQIWLIYPSKNSTRYKGTNCNKDTVSSLLTEYALTAVNQIDIDDDYKAILFISEK